MNRALFVVALSVIGGAAFADDTIPSLGLAGDYSVFGIGNTQMTISSGNTRVFGNVGVGPNSSLDFSGGGIINGNLDVDPTSSANISGGSTASAQRTINLTQAMNDAINASKVAAADPFTLDLNSITNSTNAIDATGKVSVVKVDGNVQLSGGHTLTINGNANDFFVFDVYGGFTFSGGSKMDLTGGVSANHILFNFVGSGQDINFNGNSTVDGTFLAVNRNIIDSGGQVNGALIGAENGQLKLQSGPKINGQPVPEPASMLVLAPALLMLRRKKKAA